MLEMRNVTKLFGNFVALNDLSMTVPQGAVYGLVGPNGAGKSTLMKLLQSGVLNPATIASLYGVPEAHVKIIPYPVVNAIKITIPRCHPSGALEDDDIYGCQQHMRLANLEVTL